MVQVYYIEINIKNYVILENFLEEFQIWSIVNKLSLGIVKVNYMIFSKN